MFKNQMKKLQMLNLIEKLNQASYAYYNGESIMEDAQFDSLYKELERLEEECDFRYAMSPTQKVGAEVLDHLEKISIESKPMLSLNKVHSVEEVLDFSKGRAMVAMSKCDGLSMRLVYENGVLVSANTRGNGQIGVDITAHALHMQYVPLNISYKHRIVVDGEAVIYYSDFEKTNKNDEFKNPRNTAAGTLNSLDPKLASERRLSFVAWDITEGGSENTMERRLYELDVLGFKVVPNIVLVDVQDYSIEETNNILHSIADLPTDGVVWKYNDIAYGESLGRTAHHFNWAVAWKPEVETFETRLVDIDWTMGRTGVLTPVAVFEPVDDGESVIERASLHNLSILMELLGGAPYVGQKIEIYKANMIIPQVLKADKNNLTSCYATDKFGNKLIEWDYPTISFPTVCPICGGMVKIAQEYDTKTLVCINTLCEGKLVNRLDHFVSKKGLDIKGLSKATLGKLIDWGWMNELSDIYKLAEHRDEWIKQPGFGVKSVDNILNAIEDSRHPTLDQFISSLGIPLIGKTVSKDLLNYITSYEDLKEKVNSKWDFTKIDGFAYSKANALWSFNFSEADKVREFMEFTQEEKPEAGNSLEGITFVITGKLNTYKNRSVLEELIEGLGGKVVGSVSKNTKYLINNDNESNSAKNVAAKKLGIPVITEQEFNQKFLT
jgi:DNA ligase (NAD+)